MKTFLIIFTLLFLYTVVEAKADALKASELAAMCSDDNARILCLPYIRGALETTTFYETSNEKIKKICAPTVGITVGELKEVFLKYYNANKSLAEGVLAAQLMYAAMRENYPCKEPK